MSKQIDHLQQHYALRKLSIGVASVLLGTTWYLFQPQAARADVAATPVSQQVESNADATVDSSMANAATNVQLQLNDGGQPLTGETTGQTDTEYHLSLTGSFDVQLQQLTNQQTVEIARVTTTSNNGHYMNFNNATQQLGVAYQGHSIGYLRWDYDQQSGQGSLNLTSTLTDGWSDLVPTSMLTIKLTKLPVIAVLNWETDPHKLVVNSADQTYQETMKFLDGQGKTLIQQKFNLKPVTYPVQKDALWTSITSRATGANDAFFNDYLSPLAGNNNAATIANLNQNFGQVGSLNLPQQFDLFYRLKPVNNSIIDPQQLSMYINKVPNAITSSGQMTTENHFFDGIDFGQTHQILAAADDLSFAQLNALDFVGARYSKQADGSLNIAVHLPSTWLKLTDQELTTLAHQTATGIFDPQGEDQDLIAVKRFYQGSLQQLPTRFVMGLWLGYPQDASHPDNQYQLVRYRVDGSSISQAQVKQPDAQIDLDRQSTIQIHAINAYDGNELTTGISGVTTGWPTTSDGHAASQLSLTPSQFEKALPVGYHYAVLKGQHLLNGQTWQQPTDWHALTAGQSYQLTYPTTGTTNYYYFLVPDSATATVNFIDADTRQTLASLHGRGYYQQTIVLPAVQDTLNDYLKSYSIISDDFSQQEHVYQEGDNVFTIVLKAKQDQPTPDQKDDDKSGQDEHPGADIPDQQPDDPFDQGKDQDQDQTGANDPDQTDDPTRQDEDNTSRQDDHTTAGENLPDKKEDETAKQDPIRPAEDSTSSYQQIEDDQLVATQVNLAEQGQSARLTVATSNQPVSSVQGTSQAATGTDQLPQTGSRQEQGWAALGLASLMLMLGFGLGKRQEN